MDFVLNFPELLESRKIMDILAVMETGNILTLWIVIGIGLLIAEIFSGTFYLLFSGFAALSTAFLHWLYPLPLYGEALLFAGISLAGVFLVKKKFRQERTSFKNDEDRTFVLSETLQPQEEKTVSYQGAPWAAINRSERALLAGETAKIQKIEGIKLILVEDSSKT